MQLRNENTDWLSGNQATRQVGNRMDQLVKAHKVSERNAAIARLKEWLKDGDTLYFILRHRSASGMQRIYSVKHIDPLWRIQGETETVVAYQRRISDVSSNIAQACGYSWSEQHWGVKVNGCGFSAEQEITEDVARVCGLSGLKYETL